MRLRYVLPLVALLCGGLLPALAADLPPVFAKVGDKDITREDVLKEASNELTKVRQQEYEILNATLGEMVDRALIDAAAAKEGKPGEQWINEQVEKKVSAPADSDIENLYNQLKPRLNNQTLDQARPALVRTLQNQQRQKAYNNIMADLRSRTSVKIMLDPPRATVSDGGNPIRGPKVAPVTIIEFSDYQCPFCSRLEGTIKQIEDTYGDKVRIVFRDFPLAMHRNAQKAAEAAGCAEEQGKFWEMHDKLFANQRALELDNLTTYAQDIGLDPQKFKSCLDSGKRADEIKRDTADGTSLGVSGTPASFVNGRMISGAQPFENFTKVIDDELMRAGVPIPPKPAPAPAAPPPAPVAGSGAPKPPGVPAAPTVVPLAPKPAAPAPAKPTQPDKK